jgi:hypothetical protein
VFDGVLEFDAGELGELVFVVFAGEQAIAKAVMPAINSTFLIESLSFELVLKL